MNEPKQPVDRKQMMFNNVRANAASQASPENRENFFKSCEAHGGDLAEVVAIVREEYKA